MNLLKSKLRRATAVAAGSLIGLAGVAFFASPASAHYSAVKGKAYCDTATGEYIVNWTVKTDNGRTPKSENYRFINVQQTPADRPVDGIAHTPDDNDPVFPYESNKPLRGVQKVPGTATSASLTVQVKWSDDWIQYEPSTGTVELDGKCSTPATPKPEAALVSNCDGVAVTLTNGKDAKADAVFTIKGSDGYTKDVTVKPQGEPVKVDIPGKSAGEIVVTEKSTKEPVLKGAWQKPEDCTAPEQPADDFTGGYEVTCDSLIFHIDNSKGKTTINAKFTPNKGEAQTVVVKAGETKSVTFKGAKGLEVTPTVQGEAYEAIKWDEEEKPADCASASPSPSASESPAPAPGQGGGDEGESLPLTGAAAGGIAAGAAALLAVGAVLFIMARRRKVKFTA
ncbi:cell wall anchor protein [Actinoplanes sp. NPDC049596]|uniref:cell wall anchor protein n=1 Tax=unclassified Actinoplanes TaxID=2626549 RepID=UPI00341D2AC3